MRNLPTVEMRNKSSRGGGVEGRGALNLRHGFTKFPNFSSAHVGGSFAIIRWAADKAYGGKIFIRVGHIPVQ